MKTILKFTVLIFTFFLSTQFISAQDIIYKKSGKKIHAKVKEIGLDEIKYYKYDDLDGILYSVAKDLITKIKFENGTSEFFIEDFNNPEFYADQKKRALKFRFFAPLFGYSEFTFEQNIAPGRSFEVSLGGIGLGKNLGDRDARGFYVGGSYKFYHKPSYYVRGMHYAHILKGGYLRPSFTLGTYSELDPDKGYYTGDRRNVTYATVMLNLGKQWVYSDFFLLDIFFGAGYSFDNASDDFATHNFSSSTIGEGVSFAATVGLRIGFLIK